MNKLFKSLVTGSLALAVLLPTTALASIKTDLENGLSSSEAMKNAMVVCSTTECIEQAIKSMLEAGVSLDAVFTAASMEGVSIKMLTSASLSQGQKILDIVISALNVPGVSDRSAIEQILTVNRAVKGDDYAVFKAAKEAGVAEVTIAQAARNVGIPEKEIMDIAASAGLNPAAVVAGIQVSKTGNATAAGGNNQSMEEANSKISELDKLLASANRPTASGGGESINDAQPRGFGSTTSSGVPGSQTEETLASANPKPISPN